MSVEFANQVFKNCLSIAISIVGVNIKPTDPKRLEYPDTLQVAARKIFWYESENPTFGFVISQQMEVTESFIPEFSISSFLAQIGGSLGLWLGMGAVQLIKIGIDNFVV